jgi:biopolymer transport protein ExbD
MFTSVRRRVGSSDQVSIDVTPLIDVVFILLLFFLVTTSFIKDVGIDVKRPQANAGKPLESESLRVGIAASGSVYIDGKRQELGGVREAVVAALSRDADVGVVVVPDERVVAGRLISVMDVVKGAGAKNVAVATRRKGSL